LPFFRKESGEAGRFAEPLLVFRGLLRELLSCAAALHVVASDRIAERRLVCKVAMTDLRMRKYCSMEMISSPRNIWLGVSLRLEIARPGTMSTSSTL
jgi:hypothetical protein